MKKRVISGAIMAGALLAVLLLGLKFHIVFIVTICLIAVLAYKELLDVKKDLHVPMPVMLIGLVSLLFLIVSGTSNASFIVGFDIQKLGLIFLLLLMPCVLLHKKKYNTDSGFYLFAIVVFLGMVFNQVIVLYLQSIYLFIYPILVGCMTDIFALLGGSLIGKHKFTKISPNKTIEGCVVGALFAIIIGTTFHMMFVGGLNIFTAILLSLILSIVGQIGDLFFSLIKRENEVKDFSNLIPGHGGIIDRIDGLTFIILAFVFILECI